MIPYGKKVYLLSRPATPAAGKARNLFAAIGLAATLLAAATISAPRARADGDITLREGWRVQSSAKVSASAEAVSAVGFDASSWYKTSAPNTVFAVLVENGVYKNPYFGMNLRSVPGVSYKIGSEFANQEMPADSPYAVPWWYRKEFEVPAQFSGKTVWLAFRGINYRADIWINGKKVAGSDQVVGAFRRYEFDVTPFVKTGEKNVVAVEVSAPHANELGITWVDWNPTPPDKDMGLWQEVVLSSSGPVAVRHPSVETKLDLPAIDKAHLTVRAELEERLEHISEGNFARENSRSGFAHRVLAECRTQCRRTSRHCLRAGRIRLAQRHKSPSLVALPNGESLSTQTHP